MSNTKFGFTTDDVTLAIPATWNTTLKRSRPLIFERSQKYLHIQYEINHFPCVYLYSQIFLLKDNLKPMFLFTD